MRASRKWGYHIGPDIITPQYKPVSIPSRWDLFIGVYPDPTDMEYEIIFPYLLKYEFEDDDFVEENDPHWVSLKKKYNRPNLRAECIKLLHVFRQSKGYDLTPDLIAPLNFFEPFFDPISPQYQVEIYRRCQEAAPLVIDQINTQMIPTGKKYQFLSLDNAVWSDALIQFLTITVKELDADVMEVDGDDDTYGYEVRTIRAMVQDEYSEPKFEIMEWKFEEDYSETSRSISHLSILCEDKCLIST